MANLVIKKSKSINYSVTKKYLITDFVILQHNHVSVVVMFKMKRYILLDKDAI